LKSVTASLSRLVQSLEIEPIFAWRYVAENIFEKNLHPAKTTGHHPDNYCRSGPGMAGFPGRTV
jgi:hypothetical protein